MHGSSISPESLLSYPAASSSTENPPPSVPVQPRQLLKDRLYVGNLHPTVDELVSAQPSPFCSTLMDI